MNLASRMLMIRTLPPELAHLTELAYNLRWSWDHPTIDLFRRLDEARWEASGHNPVVMLATVDPGRIDAAIRDEAFLAHYRRAAGDLEAYLTPGGRWYGGLPRRDGLTVAYFSAEFGVTECLPLYAGGLGILAGDHLKAASDLGLPMVGVGLLYRQGYFHQRLTPEGAQEEEYVDLDPAGLPIRLAHGGNGEPLTVSVSYLGREVTAQVWRAQVGRVPLYLLDTNVEENAPEDRTITARLYVAEPEARLRQEMLLGIGGVRALEALGTRPLVYHLNEGHPAFLTLEHTRLVMREQGLPFTEASKRAAAAHVFTTHTPVPAGHDTFTADLIERYLGDYAAALGLTPPEFVALGRVDPAGDAGPFVMTVLALRLARHRNAVSWLHGEVTRQMWHGLWPERPVEEVPISAVTNAVHFRSWISRELDQLYDRYLGPPWRETPADASVWMRVHDIPNEELWNAHQRRRARLVAYARRSILAQRQRGPASGEALAAETLLDPGTFTIGFARRFVGYKRPTLLLRDLDRLAALLKDPRRPVQVVFAGKAHPQDDAGKALIHQIVQVADDHRFRGRLVLVEDYDLEVARHLVQGADLWLNTPRRPLEASGTSGMKAAANGVLHCSTLDGWWDEAYAPEVGWAIGQGKTYADSAEQDRLEAEALYALLEQEIVPLFYDRGADGLPHGWIARMKASMAALCPLFNTNRMLREYMERAYLHAIEERTAAGGPS